MVDRNIPYCNIIMRMDNLRKYEIELPSGYYLDGFRRGDDIAWGEMEYQAGDFQTSEEAVAYFRRRYTTKIEMLQKRFVAVRDSEGRCLSSCIAWYDERNGETIPALEWLVTRKGFGGLGLARAAAAQTSNIFYDIGEKPVYLHTQPWSYKAIWLYHEFGFKLTSSDSFRAYTNEFEKAIPILKEIMEPRKYETIMSDIVTDIKP